VLIKSWKVAELLCRSHEHYLFLYTASAKVIGIVGITTAGYFVYTIGPALLLARLALSFDDFASFIAKPIWHNMPGPNPYRATTSVPISDLADFITNYLAIPTAKVAGALYMSAIDPTLVLLGVSSIFIVVASYYFIKSFTPVEVEECIKPKISAWVKRGESDTLALLDPKDPSQFILVTNKRKPEIYYSKKEFPTEESIQTPPGNTTLCSIDETPFTLIDDLLGTLYFISVFLVALFLL